MIVKGFGNEHFWTAGTDQGEEGSFFWMSTGRPVTFTNWNAGEPVNKFIFFCNLRDNSALLQQLLHARLVFPFLLPRQIFFNFPTCQIITQNDIQGNLLWLLVLFCVKLSNRLPFLVLLTFCFFFLN